MAKNNFNKVEGLLDQSLKKMAVEKIFEDAEKIKKESLNKNPSIEYPPEEVDKNPEVETFDSREKEHILNTLKRYLKYLKFEEHTDFYLSLPLKKREIREKVEKSASLTNPEWIVLRDIKKNMEAYRQDIVTKNNNLDPFTIEEERLKQKNKRFNINDKWLPLH